MIRYEGLPRQRSNVTAHEEDLMSEEDPSDDDVRDGGELPAEDELELIHAREVELQEELNMATQRVQELKQTLQATKSFIEARGGVPPVSSTRGGGSTVKAPRPLDARVVSTIASDDDDAEDEDTFDYEDDEEEEYEEEAEVRPIEQSI
jgi:hypothetical protein